MAGVYKLEIHESAEELKQLLRSQTTAQRKERIQVLYLLQTQQAKTVQAAADLVGRNRVTVQEWLQHYRNGGLEGLLQSKKATGRKLAQFPVRVITQASGMDRTSVAQTIARPGRR